MWQWLLSAELERLAGWFTLSTVVICGSLAVAWFVPPLRRLALEVAAVAAVATFLYGKGVHDEHALCVEQQNVADQEAIQRDKDIAAQSLQEAQDQVKQLQDQATSDEGKINDYEQQLAAARKANNAGPVCVVTTDDERRLRQFQNRKYPVKAGNKPTGATPVPRPRPGA